MKLIDFRLFGASDWFLLGGMLFSLVGLIMMAIGLLLVMAEV